MPRLNGTHSNGSDERDYAQQWFDRCWFGGHLEKDFTQFLIQHDQLDRVAGLWDDMQQAKEELAEAISRPDLYDAEDLEEFRDEISYCSGEINDLYSECHNSAEGDISVAEMEKVLLWHQRKIDWSHQKSAEPPKSECSLPKREQLFHTETIDQFKIMNWLKEQGVTLDDISCVDLLGDSAVKMTNPAGQWMVVTCRDGRVEIDQKAERDAPKPERHSIRDKLAAAKAECEQRTSKEPQHTSPNLDR